VRDHSADLVLAWSGRHGLHTYDVDGTEFDYLSVGDFSQNDATIEDVTQHCDLLLP
jgi:hypothetical protein